MNPGDIDGRRPVGGSRRATARIHIEGMTCNKCVDQGSKFFGYRRTVITKGFIKIDFLDEYEC